MLRGVIPTQALEEEARSFRQAANLGRGAQSRGARVYWRNSCKLQAFRTRAGKETGVWSNPEQTREQDSLDPSGSGVHASGLTFASVDADMFAKNGSTSLAKFFGVPRALLVGSRRHVAGWYTRHLILWESALGFKFFLLNRPNMSLFCIAFQDSGLLTLQRGEVDQVELKGAVISLIYVSMQRQTPPCLQQQSIVVLFFWFCRDLVCASPWS